MLWLVVATRADEAQFLRTPLRQSLERLHLPGDVCVEVSYRNEANLPVVYNVVLEKAADGDVVAFIHDDVWIDDWFLPLRLTFALEQFDVIGVAGNRRRVPRQPSWAFIGSDFKWDARENLSGAVAHGTPGQGRVTDFGPTPSRVVLLDGVFMAARAGRLRQSGVRFDPRFRFHFYDLDFCRSCEQAGLSMGTWPLALTHASGGDYGSPDWQAAYQEYLAKWRE